MSAALVALVAVALLCIGAAVGFFVAALVQVAGRNDRALRDLEWRDGCDD